MPGSWDEQRNGNGPDRPPGGGGRPSVSPLIWIALLLAVLSFGWYLYHQRPPPAPPPPAQIPPAATAPASAPGGHATPAPTRG
jgi:hypothetical protein